MFENTSMRYCLTDEELSEEMTDVLEYVEEHLGVLLLKKLIKELQRK